jgi:hypothetical protein
MRPEPGRFQYSTAACVGNIYTMQLRTQAQPPPGMVFDCDMAGIDDVLALAMLFGFQGKGEIRVAGLTVSRPNLAAAEFCDAVSRFYMGPPGPFGGMLPVGLNLSGKMAADTVMVAGPLARQTPDGKPLYGRSIQKANDTADPLAVIRNALSAQYDGNAMVVLAGAATNLARVLELPGAKELVAQKVRYLVAAVGAFPEAPPEPAMLADVPAARKLFALWPGPIFLVGKEIGDAVRFPGASIETDLSWTPAHPVADAYRAYRSMPYDAPSGAMAAVLQAVRPNEGYFRLSDPGTVAVRDDGTTWFTPSPGGKHRYLVLDPAQRERVTATYREIVSLRPAGRPRPFRGAAKKQ